MAFADKDEYGSTFYNVSNRVGTTGMWDDFLLVQTLLFILYSGHSVLKKASPIKQEFISKTGKPAKDTVILIKHFQQTMMNRKNPQGYINKSSGKNTVFSTIVALNNMAESVLLQSGFESLFHGLTVLSPALKPILGKEEENRHPQRARVLEYDKRH